MASMQTAPTWGIVATVAEPAPLVQAFVAHHIGLGAAEVHLYFDDPKDQTPDLLPDLAQLRLTRCDRAWWRQFNHGFRPKRQNNRQSLNATHAQSVSEVDFLLHCDADEFLRPHAPVTDELATIHPKLQWMRVYNLERAFEIGAPRSTIFDGVFKWRFDGHETPLRTGPMTPFGFTGHAAGKPMVRVRAGMNIGIHAPRWGDIKDRVVPPHHLAEQVELVHFDGLTPLHWAMKFLRQAAVFPEFLKQLPAFRIAQAERIFAVIEHPEALAALYEEVNGYRANEVDDLCDGGDMLRLTFDLSDSLAATYPGQIVDLSPGHFDALLQPNLRRWLRMARENGIL
jgi:hypothetical protein